MPAEFQVYVIEQILETNVQLPIVEPEFTKLTAPPGLPLPPTAAVSVTWTPMVTGDADVARVVVVGFAAACAGIGMRTRAASALARVNLKNFTKSPVFTFEYGVTVEKLRLSY